MGAHTPTKYIHVEKVPSVEMNHYITAMKQLLMHSAFEKNKNKRQTLNFKREQQRRLYFVRTLRFFRQKRQTSPVIYSKECAPVPAGIQQVIFQDRPP